MGNMYGDAKIWNCFVGCEFNCGYCKPSFQAQMKRQMPVIDKNGKKRGCRDCYDYIPHFHKDRLWKKLPKTEGDQFIWVGSSGDISFIEDNDMEMILQKIEVNPDKTFFFQTKNPIWFDNWEFPKNVLLGITLESDIHYPEISRCPKPWQRAVDFYFTIHPRKVITIEPILKFGFSRLLGWIRDIRPERVYIGYNSKPKRCKLPEPSLGKVKELIYELKRFTKVKEKTMREAWDEV